MKMRRWGEKKKLDFGPNTVPGGIRGSAPACQSTASMGIAGDSTEETACVDSSGICIGIGEGNTVDIVCCLQKTGA